MFVVCDWLPKELGYMDFPYENLTAFKNFYSALEIAKQNHDVLFRYRDELDYIFYDFNKQDFVEWRYTTGCEESNILGSGSTYYRTFQTHIFDEAMKAYKDGRDFLTREICVNGQYHTQYYDSSTNKFIETR